MRMNVGRLLGGAGGMSLSNTADGSRLQSASPRAAAISAWLLECLCPRSRCCRPALRNRARRLGHRELLAADQTTVIVGMLQCVALHRSRGEFHVFTLAVRATHGKNPTLSSRLAPPIDQGCNRGKQSSTSVACLPSEAVLAATAKAFPAVPRSVRRRAAFRFPPRTYGDIPGRAAPGACHRQADHRRLPAAAIADARNR